MHTTQVLEGFVIEHISSWLKTGYVINMTCGATSMPCFPVTVHEFVPKGNVLLVQIQHITTSDGKKRVPVKKQSPALGIQCIRQQELETYDNFISKIVDNYLNDFGDLCWKEDNNKFLPKLFKFMTRVKPKDDDEVQPLPHPHKIFH